MRNLFFLVQTIEERVSFEENCERKEEVPMNLNGERVLDLDKLGYLKCLVYFILGECRHCS